MGSTKADFSQRDSRWSGNLLGFAKWQTIGAYGCFVAALANVAQAQGKDVNPHDMNELLKSRKQFVKDDVGEVSDVAGPKALTEVFPDIKCVETRDWGRKLLTAEDFKFFDIRKSKTDDIIVKVDYHPERAGTQTHYCRVVGINAAGNDIEVVDSYTGKRIYISSLGAPAAKLVYRAYKYRGPGLGFASSVPEAPKPKMVDIRLNGPKTQHWNMRTSPSLGDNVRTDGAGLGGQIYSAQILDNGWARILFRSRTAYVGPKAFSKI